MKNLFKNVVDKVKSKKKAISLLSLTMVMSLFGVFAFAEDVPVEPLLTVTDLAPATTFANQLKATIPVILVAIIPLVLMIWIYPTAIKSALGMLKSAFRKISKVA